METVQLSIHDAPYAAALRQLLEQNGLGRIRTVESPDPMQDGVIVVDCYALDRLTMPLPKPERVVLITRNEPRRLAQAWNAGIRSVVFCEDPLNTAVLAILAAELRVPRTDSRVAVGHAAAASSRTGDLHGCRRRDRRGER